MNDVEPNNKILFDDMMRKINGPASRFEKDFRTLFANEHPTLQQGFVRHMIIPALEVLVSYNPDMRNQASHDWAVAALEIQHHMPTI